MRAISAQVVSRNHAAAPLIAASTARPKRLSPVAAAV
jgi:hypothetical protein